ncbi:MAG: response regulator [Alphaproteobacteria bacterium]|nr:response regulator [Alphaproteobacteria bacterium]
MLQQKHIVLVIDDSATIRKLVGDILTKNNFQAVVAESVEFALENFSTMNVRVVVTDLIMPGIGGLAGISFLRSHWQDVGIVAMSAGSKMMGPRELLKAAREVGAHRILQKPFSDASLLESVNSLLDMGYGDSDRRERVLVIEDSNTVRTILCRYLQDGGFQVEQASNMEQALESSLVLAVDLIITDIFMPGQGGIQGIMTIKENWPHIPILAVSGGVSGSGGEDQSSDKALQAALKIGASSVLKKPFTQEAFLKKVNGMLGN